MWGNRENPVFDWINLIHAKNKGHTIVMHDCVLRKCASFVDLIFGVLLSKVFFSYLNNKLLRVKQNILWIKWITSPDVNRFIVKIVYRPQRIYVWRCLLRPDGRNSQTARTWEWIMHQHILDHGRKNYSRGQLNNHWLTSGSLMTFGGYGQIRCTSRIPSIN